MNEYLLMILGAATGCVLPYIVKSIKFAYRRTKNSYICGDWLLYIWWTNNGNTTCAEMNGVVRRGITSEYRVVFSGGTVDYVGDAFIETNNLCMTASLKDDVYEGTTFHRYNLSTVENRNMLYGFWISRNGDCKVSCGGALLSRARLTENELGDIIEKHYEINTKLPALNLMF